MMVHYLFLMEVCQTLFKILFIIILLLILFKGLKLLQKNKNIVLIISCLIITAAVIAMYLTLFMYDTQRIKLILGLSIFLITGAGILVGMHFRSKAHFTRMGTALLIMVGLGGFLLALGYFILPAAGSIVFFEM